MMEPKYLSSTDHSQCSVPGTVLNTGNVFSDGGRYPHGDDSLMGGEIQPANNYTKNKKITYK